MKPIIFVVTILSCTSLLIAGPTKQGMDDQAPAVDQPTEMSINKIEHIFVGVNALTTVHVQTTTAIESIGLGADVADVDTQEEQGGYCIGMKGKVLGGVSNMNITFVDGSTYVLLIEVVNDKRIEYRRVMTFAGERKKNELAALGQTRVMKPQEINYVGIVGTIELAAKDAVFRKTIANYKVAPIGKQYPWNNCIIHLLEAHAFIDQDLIVLKIQWVNTHTKALRLSSRQIGVFVANTELPVTATQQRTALLLPGQMDTIYVFIQGERLNYKNNWEIGLPPDAATVKSMLRAGQKGGD